MTDTTDPRAKAFADAAMRNTGGRGVMSPSEVEADMNRTVTISQTTKETRRIPAHDVETLKVCVAGAWAHGTISGGRARELARSCGWDQNELEILKISEERKGAENV